MPMMMTPMTLESAAKILDEGNYAKAVAVLRAGANVAIYGNQTGPILRDAMVVSHAGGPAGRNTDLASKFRRRTSATRRWSGTSLPAAG
jgi:hypothetical protein